jgi:hypothetical protein
VDEVQVDARQRHGELRESVQRRLLRAPVETVAPVLDQRLQVAHARSGGPGLARRLVRPARASQPRAQVVEHGVGDAQREGSR